MKHNGIHKTAYIGLGSSVLAVTLALAPAASADTVIFMGGTCMCWNAPTSADADAIVDGYLASRGETQGLPYWAGMAFPVTIPTGALRAMGVVNSTAGKVVLSGVSQGALAIHDYELRVMSLPEDKRPDKDKLSFVVIADEAGRNGILTKNPILQILVPVSDIDTPYDTISIARQYDGFADWPDQPNPLAIANAVMGIAYYHPDYSDVNIGAPGTIVTETVNSKGGKTTHYVVPTPGELPLTKPLHDTEKFLTGKTDFTDGVDRVVKPIIDSAYDRDGSKAKARAEQREASSAAVKAEISKNVKQTKANAKKHRQETRAAVKGVVKKVDKAVKKALGKKDQ